MLGPKSVETLNCLATVKAAAKACHDQAKTYGDSLAPNDQAVEAAALCSAIASALEKPMADLDIAIGVLQAAAAEV